MKKRVFAIIIMCCLILPLLPIVAVASDSVALSATKDEVQVGDTFDVSLVVPSFVDKAYTASFKYFFDNTVFEVVSFSAPAVVDKAADGSNSSSNFISCTYTGVDGQNTLDFTNGLTITATFKVKDGATAGSYDFTVDTENTFAYQLDEDTWEDVSLFTEVDGIKTTVTVVEEPSAPAVQGYSAYVTASPEVIKGNEVTVYVGVSHSSDSKFNAGEIQLSYDPAAMTLVVSSVAELDYTNKDGVLTIEDYGEDKDFGTGVYTIKFTADKIGSTTVTLTSAKFIHKDNAANNDLTKATITTATATVTIKADTVEVTQDSTNNAGLTNVPTEAVKNEDFTFSVVDSHLYDYDVTATVGGQKVDVTDSGNGTYTIAGADVTGAVTISSTRTGKYFDVEWSGDGINDVTGEKLETAQYGGTGITFTVPSDIPVAPEQDGTTYSAEVTIGGKTTSYTAGQTVTISGNDITGSVTIVVTKETVPANGKTVSISGADVTFEDGTTANKVVAPNTKVKLILTPELGYTYSVKVGDQEIMNNNITSYELTVTDDVTVVVTKTLNKDNNVEVKEYLSLGNDKKLYLITYKIAFEEGKTATYNGNTMYYSSKYTAYCYLVEAETMPAVDAVKALLDAAEREKINVNYGGNVNNSTQLDAADAQYVYNMYNAMYSAIDENTTMLEFLSADMNGDKVVDSEDAQYIINQILGISNNQ